jgi:hypothetical protein
MGAAAKEGRGVYRLHSLVLLLALAAPLADAAETCQLTPLAALPMAASATSVPVVPGHVGGQSAWLIVDTGAIRSLIFEHAADALKVARSELRNSLDTATNLVDDRPLVVRMGRAGMRSFGTQAPSAMNTAKIAMLNEMQWRAALLYGAGGQPIHEQTAGLKVGLGKVDIPDLSFLVIPDVASVDNVLTGMVGMDVLSNYDVELNLAQHWINLFSPDHCEGQVVYWGEAYLKAPVEINAAGQMLLHATLDGQRIEAMIDTGATHSSLHQRDASWLFGLTPKSPGVVEVGSTHAADGAVLTAYSAPFKTLEVAGITFQNPEIHILPDARQKGEAGRDSMNARSPTPILTLGLNELKRLRIYLALRERMLYLTPAHEDQPT